MKKIAQYPESDVVVVEMTTAEYIKYYDIDKPEEPDSLFFYDVPHVPQNGPTADARRNDRGAACSAMIIQWETGRDVTVDELAVRYQQEPNKYMSFSDISTMLRDYGVGSEKAEGFRPDDVVDYIMNDGPCILLVKYPHLTQKCIQYNGSRFVVAYGYDGEHKEVLYHDPLCKTGGQRIKLGELDKAMSLFTGGNRPYQGLLVL